MSITGLEIFDTTLHKTHLWLKDVMHELGRPASACLYGTAGRLARAARPPHGRGSDGLGGATTAAPAGVSYEGWNITDKPFKEHHRGKSGRLADAAALTAACPVWVRFLQPRRIRRHSS
jgi:hypothetical protein